MKLASLLGFCFLTCAQCTVSSTAQTVPLGAGAYATAPKSGDPKPPVAPFRTDALLAQAAPTNQWYSTLVFHERPDAIYAHPLSVKAVAAGIEVALPRQQVVPTERQDVEIHYAHQSPLLVSPVAFTAGKAKLARISDWSIDISQAQGTDALLSTVTHGSPYVYFQITRGDVRIQLPASGQRLTSLADPRALVIQTGEQTFALFGPAGVVWQSIHEQEWIAKMPEGKGYLSLAALPNKTSQEANLQLVAEHAYAFVTDTKVSWQFDAASSKLESLFKTSSKTMEGPAKPPLQGLYPHHWYQNANVQSALRPGFDSLRGHIQLLAASEFKTSSTYQGFVPYWPAVTGSEATTELQSVMKTDVRNARRMMLELGNGPYWQGKGLQRIAKLMDIAQQQGDMAARDQLLALLKSRIEQWFSGKDSKTYFQLDKTLGTVVAHPEEYFSIEQMNDHHFHYGYWIRTMADIALRDPAWASKTQWGGMVDLLIADIATAERGRADFPFLRHFDVYEGHSWASGVGLGEHGNNQESSSEAINAWAGLIQWGDITGNKSLRDLGIYLYTTEIEAIHHYWFDNYGINLPKAYKNVEVSMLFGGKIAHNTWWIDEPRQIKGINLLPLTTASNYLGRSPDHVRRSMTALTAETALYAARGRYANPPDIWQDIFAKYLALTDPAAGLQSWKRWGSFELGDTRTHTLHWLYSLQTMGPPDFGVTADTTFYSVFKQSNGKKTYLAYNAGAAPITVRFSDGQTLSVAPNALAKSP
jgi:endoglucanase Acf2